MNRATSKIKEASATIMMAAPLLPVALGMVVGIVVDSAWRPSAWFHVSFFIVGIAPILNRRARTAMGPWLIGLASIGFGGLLHLHAARTLGPSSVERYVGEQRSLARVRGVIVDEPRVSAPPPTEFKSWSAKLERTVFLFDVTAIEGAEGDIPIDGRLRVVIGEPILDLHAGEPVEVFGWLYAVSSPGNPGAFDWAAFYARRGVAGGMFCKQRENVRRLAPDRADSGYVAWWRAKLRSLLTDDLVAGADSEASLLEAMVLGHRSRLDRRINDIFIRAGCIHFLAVSGIHVVIVMALAAMLCRLLRGGPNATTIAMIAAVVFYALIAEPRPPILRASVIALIYCAARLMGRERACLNWISATVIILAVADPGMVFDLGYQLSTAAVLGVSYLSPALRAAAWELYTIAKTRILGGPHAEEDRRIAALPGPTIGTWRWHRRRLVNLPSHRLGNGLAITCGAWLAGAPIVAVYFQQVYPWGALNSIIALPIVTVLMFFGLAKVVVTAISPQLGSLIGLALDQLDSFLLAVVGGLSHLPGSPLPVRSPPWWVLVAFYMFLLAFVWRFHPDSGRAGLEANGRAVEERSARRAKRAALMGSLGLIFFALLVWVRTASHGSGLTVTVLSVGAGSAAVVETPGGRAVMIDAGSSGAYDVGASTIVPFLRDRGIHRIERVYLSHPNLDHFSGVPTLIDELEVGPIVMTEYFKPLSKRWSPSRHLLKLLKARKQPVERIKEPPESWALDGVRFEWLWPPPGLDKHTSANDTSMVLRISYAGRSVLLTGDIENIGQRGLLAHGDLHADVLVLPHHGSVRATSAAFIEAVGAATVIRSSRQRMDETYNGLGAIVGDAAVYNTADLGAVRVTITSTGSLTVTSYRSRVAPLAEPAEPQDEVRSADPSP